MARAVWYRVSLFCLGLLMAVSFTLDWPAAAEPQLATALTQGKRLYEAGQLTSAATVLEDVLRQSQGDALTNAIALGNLALVYGQQGNWTAAQQSITRSQQQLGSQLTTSHQWSVYAQTLNIQARLQLAQNNALAAFDTWGQAAEAYATAGDDYRAIRSQIRQARALQAQGFYRRAVDEILKPLAQQLEQTPASTAKSLSLRSLAEALQIADSLNTAKQAAEEALAIATALNNTNEIAASRLTLANINYSEAQALVSRGEQNRANITIQTALDLYQQVSDQGDAANQLRAQLNQLGILVDNNRLDQALALWTTIQPQVNQLPANRTGIYARINLAQNLPPLVNSGLPGAPDWQTTLNILETAARQASTLDDRRAQAYVTGYLGQIYIEMGNLVQAQQLTEQALFIAKTVNAADITYRWYEQLGDLQVKQGDEGGAISAYTGAVNTLKTLRTDLLTINPEVQFSFKDSIEPVHRKLVGLLLDAAMTQTGTDKQNQLKSARDILESLQLEELNNYLRAACLNNQQVAIDELPDTHKVAVFYPIILEQRLSIIVSLPEQGLILKEVTVNKTDFEAAVDKWRDGLTNRISLGHKNNGQQLYEWLIAPIQPELAADNISTLVFVLDGVLRNTPMAALYDGKQYLIEQYSVAIAPGLRLINPKALRGQQLTGLAFGLTSCDLAACRNVPLSSGDNIPFDDLSFVPGELESIEKTLPNIQVIKGETFTKAEFETAVTNTKASIVHLATHGNFSSDPNDTFLLTADGPIDVDQFATTIQTNQERTEPIELMVLSACETASGDPRAALGMAGMAIRAGARSTLASLWNVNDESTSVLMQQFYKSLASQQFTKAEALRQAQLEIINSPQFRGHPYFWAPFVMIGNWL